jgi:hypothetical protein
VKAASTASSSGSQFNPAEVADFLSTLFDDTMAETTEVATMEASEKIVTPLLQHQQEALAWMVHRENSGALPPFWQLHKVSSPALLPDHSICNLQCGQTSTIEQRVVVAAGVNSAAAERKDVRMDVDTTCVAISMVWTQSFEIFLVPKFWPMFNAHGCKWAGYSDIPVSQATVA